MNLGEYSANASAPLIVPALRSCFQRAGFVVRRKTPPFFWHPYVNSERYHPQGSRMEPMKALPLSRSSGVAWLCLPSFTPPTVFFSSCLIWVEPVFCSSRNTSFLLTSMQRLSAGIGDGGRPGTCNKRAKGSDRYADSASLSQDPATVPLACTPSISLGPPAPEALLAGAAGAPRRACRPLAGARRRLAREAPRVSPGQPPNASTTRRVCA